VSGVEARTVTLDAGEFAYREAGPPDGTPAVMLHGLGSRAATWDRIAAGLAGRGYRTLALDQRGHGDSARTADYSFELLRDDVAAFAAALRLGRFVLIGHSMGGTAACLYAERFPDRLTALVLEDTPPPHYRSTLRIPDQPPADVPFHWPLAPAISAQFADPDPAWWDDLVKITAPTLVLAGGPTSHVPQDLLAEAAARIPDGRLVTVDGAGHHIHREYPAEFLAHLTAFLAERG